VHPLAYLTYAFYILLTSTEKLQFLTKNQPEMVLNCALVQRAITKSVKLRSAAFCNSAAKATKRIKIWSAVQIKKRERQVSNVRTQLTKTKSKTAKKDSQQRGIITRLRTQLDACNKENDELCANQQEHKRQVGAQRQEHDKVVHDLRSDLRQLRK